MAKYKKIKKYDVHILALAAVKADLFDYPLEKNAVIVVTNRDNRFLSEGHISNLLTLPFPDYEDKETEGAFNRAHARAIIRFLDELPDTVTDVYVCCSKGGSRSAAIAAALLRMSGRSDRDVWQNPYYVPNTLVYYRLCKEFGLFVTEHSVARRRKQNEKAFRDAKAGNPCKYERWQVLR